MGFVEGFSSRVWPEVLIRRFFHWYSYFVIHVNWFLTYLPVTDLQTVFASYSYMFYYVNDSGPNTLQTLSNFSILYLELGFSLITNLSTKITSSVPMYRCGCSEKRLLNHVQITSTEIFKYLDYDFGHKIIRNLMPWGSQANFCWKLKWVHWPLKYTLGWFWVSRSRTSS